MDLKPLTAEELEVEKTKMLDELKFKIQLNEQEISVLTTKVRVCFYLITSQLDFIQLNENLICSNRGQLSGNI